MSAKAINRFEFEQALWLQGVTRVAGVDEAGRGPLAGPVVAAAVILPATWATPPAKTPLPMNLVAADVSPLHLDREGSLSRLMSAAAVQGFKARTSVGKILTPSLAPSDGETVAEGRLKGFRTTKDSSIPNGASSSSFDTRLVNLNDSKQLTEAQRENFFQIITTHPDLRFAIAIVDAATIDRINILQATHRAMNDALARLQPPPEHVLVDGRPVKSMTLPQTALVKGDARSYSIAAASVLAKVTRDRLMREFEEKFPGYGFAVHKGYGVPQHLAAIEKFGPCPIHRMSFAPLKQKQTELL